MGIESTLSTSLEKSCAKVIRFRIYHLKFLVHSNDSRRSFSRQVFYIFEVQWQSNVLRTRSSPRPEPTHSSRLTSGYGSRKLRACPFSLSRARFTLASRNPRVLLRLRCSGDPCGSTSASVPPQNTRDSLREGSTSPPIRAPPGTSTNTPQAGSTPATPVASLLH